MDGAQVSSPEISIEERLNSIHTIIWEQNEDHTLVIYQVLAWIQEEVSHIQNLSPEIVQRIQDSITLVEWLLPAGKEEIEENFLSVYRKKDNIDILPVKGALILYIWENTPILLPCWDLQSTIVKKLIEYPQGLAINEENKLHLLKESSLLNELLNTYGVFFGIKNNMFIFSDCEVWEEKKSWWIEKKIEKIVATPKILFTTSLGFERSAKRIQISFYTPIKKWKNIEIKCNVWSKSKKISQRTLFLFLELLSNKEKGAVLSWSDDKLMRNFLQDTDIELIWNSWGIYKIIIRSDSLNPESIKYVSHIDTELLKIEQILENTISDTIREFFIVEGYEIEFLGKKSVRWGFRGKISLLFPGNNEYIEVDLRWVSYNLLEKLINQNGVPIKITNSEQNVWLPELKKTFGDNFIRKKWWEWYYLWTIKENSWELKENTVRKVVKSKRKEIFTQDLFEEEIISFESEEWNIRTIKKVGKWNFTKYYISINGEELAFTPSQNFLIKKLLGIHKDIKLSKNEIIYLRKICRVLDQAWYETLSKFLISKKFTRKKKKISPKIIERKAQDSEKIDEIIWMKHIKTLKVTWRWKMQKFHIQVWEDIIQLSPKQMELFILFCKSKKNNIKFSESKDYIAFLWLLKHLKKCWLETLVQLFQEKRETKYTSKKRRDIDENSMTWKMQKRKNLSLDLLEQEEKINLPLWDLHIQIDSKQGNGNLCKYKLLISKWQKKQEVDLTRKEYEIFFQLTQNIWSPTFIPKNNIQTLHNLRRKLPNTLIKNKRWEWYYMGRLSDKYLMDTWKIEPSVDEMIDEALRDSSPLAPTNNRERRHPIMRKAQENYEKLEWTGAKFIEIIVENPWKTFTLEELLSELSIDRDTYRRNSNASLEVENILIDAIEHYNLQNSKNKIIKRNSGWCLPKWEIKWDNLDDEFNIWNFLK